MTRAVLLLPFLRNPKYWLQDSLISMYLAEVGELDLLTRNQRAHLFTWNGKQTNFKAQAFQIKIVLLKNQHILSTHCLCIQFFNLHWLLDPSSPLNSFYSVIILRSWHPISVLTTLTEIHIKFKSNRGSLHWWHWRWKLTGLGRCDNAQICAFEGTAERCGAYVINKLSHRKANIWPLFKKYR